MFFKKYDFTSFHSVNACLSVYMYTQCNPRFHNRCLFQLSLATFKLLFLQQHVSISCNTIVYRDTKIYCSNVKTLRFLEKLCSVAGMPLAPQLTTNILISGLILIFIKYGMCQVLFNRLQIKHVVHHTL